MTDSAKLTKEQLAEQHLQKEHAWLDRLKNEYALVQQDIQNGDTLNDIRYRELLEEIEARLSSEHVSDFLISIHENIEGIDRVTGDSLDTPGVHLISDIISFFANFSRLIAFRKRQQELTLAEKIIVGLSFLGIALVVGSVIFGVISTGIGAVALGFVLAGFAVSRAMASLANLTLSIRVRKAKLEKVIAEDVVALEAEIDEKLKMSPSEVDIIALRESLDKYVAAGYTIHRLRDELQKDRNVWPTRIHLTMASCVLVGAICLFIPPLMPVGGVVIGIAGIVSSVTLIGSWVRRRREMQSLSPKDAKAMREGSKAPQTMKEQRYFELYKAAFLTDKAKPRPMGRPRRPLDSPLAVDKDPSLENIDRQLMDSTEVEMIELDLAPRRASTAKSEEPANAPPSLPPAEAPHIEPSPLHSSKKKDRELADDELRPKFDEKH